MIGGAVRVTGFVVALVAITTGVTACVKAPTSPAGVVPFTQTDLVVGTGAEAATGAIVTVNYTGWLYSSSAVESKGPQFDTSLGTTPLSFTLGAGQVIAGWDLGVPGMKVGGRRRLIIPPSYGYGGIRSGIIPPYGTLLFEIELLEVQ